jgi:hypothetical protein
MSEGLAVITEQTMIIFELGNNLHDLGVHEPHDFIQLLTLRGNKVERIV